MKSENQDFIIAALECGRYSVSSGGLVFSHISGKKKPLSRKAPVGGYIHNNLCFNGTYRKCAAHRVVWIATHGRIRKGVEINHKNGIKTDNRPENLELVTHAENISHAVVTGLTAKGERNHASKITDEDAVDIRYLLRLGNGCGFTYRKIGALYGISHATVWALSTGRTWSHA